MAKTKKEEALVPEEEVIQETKPKEPKYTKEAIAASKEFSGYQRDFVHAILQDEYYTLREAKKTVTAYFNKKKEV